MVKRLKSRRLKRKNISNNKVTGGTNYNIDYSTITDRSGYITDSFYTYSTCKYQFSDFHNKVFQDSSWISKPRFLLEAKAGKYFVNTPEGIEDAFYTLSSFYIDINDPLKRLLDGYHDSMFIRFAFEIGMFTTEQHFYMVLRYWDLAIMNTMRAFYNSQHKRYDLTANKSYTAYFDTHFSKVLCYRIKALDYADKHLLEDPVQLVRLDQLPDSDMISYTDDYNLI